MHLFEAGLPIKLIFVTLRARSGGQSPKRLKKKIQTETEAQNVHNMETDSTEKSSQRLQEKKDGHILVCNTVILLLVCHHDDSLFIMMKSNFS